MDEKIRAAKFEVENLRYSPAWQAAAAVAAALDAVEAVAVEVHAMAVKVGALGELLKLPMDDPAAVDPAAVDPAAVDPAEVPQ